MKKTRYTIEERNNSYIVLDDGKVLSLCIDNNSALHSIWVENGSVDNDFYVVDKGKVYKIEKDTR